MLKSASPCFREKPLGRDAGARTKTEDVYKRQDVKRGTLTYIASIAEASGVSAETAPASAAAPRKRARARIIPLRRAAAALAACLALAFAGFGGFAYAQPTTYVGIDINPSIELGVNQMCIRDSYSPVRHFMSARGRFHRSTCMC